MGVVSVSEHRVGAVAKMIQLKSMLNVIDNSGAAVAECINVLKMNRAAKVGDRIIVVVQKQRNFGPESGPGGSVSVSAANKVRRGDIRRRRRPYRKEIPTTRWQRCQV